MAGSVVMRRHVFGWRVIAAVGAAAGLAGAQVQPVAFAVLYAFLAFMGFGLYDLVQRADVFAG
jgi:hypothetical protein